MNNHCPDCGAYLANQETIDHHAAWHTALAELLTQIATTANHADAFHRLYGGRPT